MRGNRKCGTCVWYDDTHEDFHKRFVPLDGLCHWRMPPQLVEATWGGWSQKGPAGVRADDWCSCHQELKEHMLDGERRQLAAPEIPLIAER